MSYQKRPVFTCSGCRRSKPGRLFFFLPKGWTGSDAEDGVCFCKKCTKVFSGKKRLK